MRHKTILNLWGILFLVLPLALARGQTVTGTNFTLTSLNGNITAQLTTSGEGTPALFFYDTKHTARISIGLYPDGAPGIVLNDNTGKAAAILRLVENNGNPVLVLKENGQDQLVINKNGIPTKSSTMFGSIGSFLAGLILIVSFVAGLIGGLVFTQFILKKQTIQSP